MAEDIGNLGTYTIVITPGASTTGGVSQGVQAFATLTLADALTLVDSELLACLLDSSGVRPVGIFQLEVKACCAARPVSRPRMNRSGSILRS
ncbi:MAG: hypothetical protein HY900_17285 [Deltaproteobacteria bacterium]|nr:hypothetical protein [Deltaproteobacteria bacterium]